MDSFESQGNWPWMSLDSILWADPFGLITDLSSSLIIRMFNLGLKYSLLMPRKVLWWPVFLLIFIVCLCSLLGVYFLSQLANLWRPYGMPNLNGSGEVPLLFPVRLSGDDPLTQSSSEVWGTQSSLSIVHININHKLYKNHWSSIVPLRGWPSIHPPICATNENCYVPWTVLVNGDEARYGT